MKSITGNIAIEGKNIVKDFELGNTMTRVLKDVSIKVLKGEFVSINLRSAPHTICCFSPVCLNVVFLSLPPSQAALFHLLSEKRGRRKIISHSAGHSVVTGIWAEKKPAHQCVPINTKG